MTTIRCCLCGEAESEQVGIVLEAGEACFDCLTSLVENEIERRGVAEQERQFRQYWEGRPTQDDCDRQLLIEAGRGHLVR